jgi:hypothetical protein
MDGLTFTLVRGGFANASKAEHEFLNFGFTAKLQGVKREVNTHHLFLYKDMPMPKDIMCGAPFFAADFGRGWVFQYNKLHGKQPTDLRMWTPPHATTNPGGFKRNLDRYLALGSNSDIHA